MHCKENSVYVFLFWELFGLSPNFHIHVSVSDLRIYSQDRSTYFLQQNMQIDRENIKNALGIFVSNFQFWFFAVWTKNKQEHAVKAAPETIASPYTLCYL